MARGGYRPNSGRKPIEKRLSNYEKAIKMLDDSVEDALQVLIDGLDSDDKNYRLRCAEILLKKSIPDKNRQEVTGEDGEAIEHTIRVIREK